MNERCGARFAHLTFPKAGSQWVSDVLSDPEIVSSQPNVSVVRRPAGGYTMAEFASEPKGAFVGPMFNVPRDWWIHRSEPDDRCVLVLRDPRDVIVSGVFSMAYSHESNPLVHIIRPALLSLGVRGKCEVLMHNFSTVAPVWRSWTERPDAIGEKIVRYESLVAEPLPAFRAMFDHFGWRISDEVLEAVIRRHSFEARSGRQRGDKQAFSHYRNGVAGDWAEYFNRDLAQRFEAAFPGLLVALGYEPDTSWWKERPMTLAALTTLPFTEREMQLVHAFNAATDIAERLARDR
jgi:hypothetical protein